MMQMKILTNYNTTFNLNQIPDNAEDIRFGVLDYSDQANVDYYFIPLIFLESFNSPCVDLRIGNLNIQMPLDWSVIIGDKNSGEMEIMPLIYLNDKDFDVFCYNPINGFMPHFLKLEVLNLWPDVNWYFPKLKNGQILAVPLSDGPAPLCAYFLKDIGKIPESLDIRKLV
jgi:hypothetical protein